MATAKRITFSIDDFRALPKRIGRVSTEQRCTFDGSSHVFDLSFFVVTRLPDPTSPLDRVEISTPPDLAIDPTTPTKTS